MLNPSTVAFLHQHNISFDKWTKEGIPFLEESKAQEIIESYSTKVREAEAQPKEEEARQPTIQEASQRRVQLRRTEDIDFFSRAMAGLRNFLDSPVNPNRQQEPEGASFELPECNSFLRRALYESIGQEYPSLILEKVPGRNSIKVWRLSDEEKILREERLKREKWESLILEVGLTRIFHALSKVAQGFELERDSVLLAPSLDEVDFDKEPTLYRAAKNRKIPIVVHNGFMDLCFLMTHFVSNQLPESLDGCKSLIREHFPIIYDTKILATEYSLEFQNDNSRLDPLFERVKGVLEQQVRVIVPEVEDGEVIASESHHADYDAYMTGVCFIAICLTINRATDLYGSGVESHNEVGSLLHLLEPADDLQVRKTFGRNLLYQFSMYTMDLEKKRDPLCKGMDERSAFRVSGFDPSVATRDIVATLSGLIDQNGNRVNFEIVWLDDTTFIVAARSLLDDLLLEHGILIRDALKQRFKESTITSLATLTDEKVQDRKATNDVEGQSGKRSFFSRVMGLFRSSEPEDRARKRRRMN